MLACLLQHLMNTCQRSPQFRGRSVRVSYYRLLTECLVKTCAGGAKSVYWLDFGWAIPREPSPIIEKGVCCLIFFPFLESNRRTVFLAISTYGKGNVWIENHVACDIFLKCVNITKSRLNPTSRVSIGPFHCTT